MSSIEKKKIECIKCKKEIEKDISKKQTILEKLFQK